jgi:hypothetical protein
MKINLNKDVNFELLNLNEFYKLVNIGYNVDYVVQYLGKGKGRGNDKSISLKLIMASENNYLRNTNIGEIREWGSYPADDSYFIDLEDEPENNNNETI